MQRLWQTKENIDKSANTSMQEVSGKGQAMHTMRKN
jgi:hypothetical protein